MPSPLSTAALSIGSCTRTVVEIRTTYGHVSQATSIVDRLLSARLAACVQIDPEVRSHYLWKGARESAVEVRCTVKTSVAAAERCVAAILADHPYETPELLVTAVGVSDPYADWVEASVSDDPDSAGDEA